MGLLEWAGVDLTKAIWLERVTFIRAGKTEGIGHGLLLAEGRALSVLEAQAFADSLGHGDVVIRVESIKVWEGKRIGF